MRSKRNKPIAINAGSMADIAFLLLVFFLVTTTMDAQIGIHRKLPPDIDSEGQIERRNVMQILVNEQDQILAQGEKVDLAELKNMALEFIENKEERIDLPEKVTRNVDGIGPVPVSKQVISLQNDVRTSYGTYVQVQDVLAGAYREARNNYSIILFGESYDELVDEKKAEQVNAIRQVIPQRISEAEPYE